ncbi:hypothetical protein K450DRAFT_249446 [Umbelopsis ramanniana AG]|uniref:Uncharacterized protein n=1 Tax=Umbelopsis ramanniana AG TaxID=1314678 RepID=A0AAD5HDA7_UMBRA|nr:uncharacterized protein K450DRAFT_249446 [Umbelopsis ramanniana AG]KAI8577998.1 hypothetical protein K450DRAFT_249446 [Umbelopsis ramanniana AG]
MWLNPPKRLIGGNKQWTTIAHSDNLCVQASPQGRPRSIYRLVTRRYPNYKLSESYDQETIYQAFTLVAEQLRELDGKVTSKRIAKHVHQLLLQNNKLFSLTSSSTAVTDEDESDYEANGSPLAMQGLSASVSSTSSDETPQPTATPDLIPISTIKTQIHQTAAEIPITPPADIQLPPLELPRITSLELVETPEEVDIGNNFLENTAWVDPDLMAAFSYFFEGPQLGRSGESGNVKRKRKSDAEKKRDPQSLLDIPFMFISLLTYPEVPQEADNDKAQKIRFTALREISFVRNRRRMLLGITFYCLFLRFCSFDFFLFALFCTNCGMLYLMKKSGSVNVTMAKRAVRQRITWARQWTGLLLSRNNNTEKSSSSNKEKSKTLPTTLQRKQTASSIGSVAMLRTNSSPVEVRPPTSPVPTGASGSRFSSFGKALFRHKSSKGNSSIPPSSANPETLKVDTRKVSRNSTMKSPDVDTPPAVSPPIQKSLSDASLPKLMASHSLDEIINLNSEEIGSGALETVDKTSKAAKRISSSF